VEWTAADRHGNRELQGLPEELIRLFSKRTDQIDLEVERLQADGRERTPRLVKWAVHATRKPKQQETPDTLYGRWRTEAAERGMDLDVLVRQVTGRTPNRDRDLSEPTVAAMLDRLAAPDGLTATASTFARQDVIAALGGQLAGATRTQLEELADQFCAERTVSVVADRTVEERRWSTPELLAVEQRLVAAATDRIGEQTAAVSHQAVRAALAAHPTAGDDQQGMVRDVCQGGAGVALVVGRAGTGKTFALGAARHALQLDGYRPLAAAPTGIATVSLEAEGFEEVATCDRLLADLDRGREPLDSRTVLVVDEAGMLGSPQAGPTPGARPPGPGQGSAGRRRPAAGRHRRRRRVPRPPSPAGLERADREPPPAPCLGTRGPRARPQRPGRRRRGRLPRP
jgi:hypothetical protein